MGAQELSRLMMQDMVSMNFPCIVVLRVSENLLEHYSTIFNLSKEGWRGRQASEFFWPPSPSFLPTDYPTLWTCWFHPIHPIYSVSPGLIIQGHKLCQVW